MSNDPLWDALADVLLASKRFIQVLEAWSSRPVTGRILINGELSLMGGPTNPTPIPDNDVPCNVVWSDRFGDVIANEPTTWTSEDQNGADASSMVTVAARSRLGHQT